MAVVDYRTGLDREPEPSWALVHTGPLPDTVDGHPTRPKVTDVALLVVAAGRLLLTGSYAEPSVPSCRPRTGEELVAAAHRLAGHVAAGVTQLEPAGWALLHANVPAEQTAPRPHPSWYQVFFRVELDEVGARRGFVDVDVAVERCGRPVWSALVLGAHLS
jgi:hypothetical protein